MGDEVETALEALFKAYDIDESGELSRDEFLKIETRLCFGKGEVFKEDARTAKMTLADRDRSGSLDYEEFRDRQLRLFYEMDMSKADILQHVNDHIKMALAERVKMGPRYHAGIRSVLKQIFNLYDTSGDGSLSPEEWISAQKVVALEVSDDIDESWIDEAAFSAADTNGDGVLDMSEFLEASFSMFEGVKRRTDAILATLQRVVAVLEQQQSSGKKETGQVFVHVQASAKPEFQSPRNAWQDEPTDADRDANSTAWATKGSLALPLGLTTTEEITSLVRLFLQIPADTWISLYFCGPAPDGGSRPVTLVKDSNITSMLQYFTKPNAEMKLFIKNQRKRPSKLIKQPHAWEDREAMLSKRSGNLWGLDWETQLVGDGSPLPPRPLVIMLGDALIIEIPQSDEWDSQKYQFVDRVYMDRTDILTKPFEEIEVKKAKKKKKKAASELDPMLQLHFVSLKEGKCVMFVDVSWEDQEEKLCKAQGLIAPVAENSIARIGPIEVDVQKPTPGAQSKDKDVKIQWWNGEKWSAKKGPARKKKKGK